MIFNNSQWTVALRWTRSTLFQLDNLQIPGQVKLQLPQMTSMAITTSSRNRRRQNLTTTGPPTFVATVNNLCTFNYQLRLPSQETGRLGCLMKRMTRQPVQASLWTIQLIANTSQGSNSSRKNNCRYAKPSSSPSRCRFVWLVARQQNSLPRCWLDRLKVKSFSRQHLPQFLVERINYLPPYTRELLAFSWERRR